MSKLPRFGHALYEGKVSIDFVGRKWLWYSISALIVVARHLRPRIKGLNLGIEFKGGVEYQVAMPTRPGAPTQTSTKIRDAAAEARDADIPTPASPVVNTVGTNTIRVQTEPLTNDQVDEDRHRDPERRRASTGTRSAPTPIGATWGAQVAERALLGLVVFLVLVVLFIWAYFREWKMSVGAHRGAGPRPGDHRRRLRAVRLRGHPGDGDGHPDDPRLLALRHRGRLRQGAREHQEPRAAPGRPTPRRPTSRSTRPWCGRSTPRSWRCCPVGALLYVGVVSLGSGALKDLALALFVGMAAGAYSSIFIATPLRRAAQGAGAGCASRRRSCDAAPQARGGRPLRRGAGLHRGHADRRAEPEPVAARRAVAGDEDEREPEDDRRAGASVAPPASDCRRATRLALRVAVCLRQACAAATASRGHSGASSEP